MGDTLDLAVGLTEIAHIGDTVDEARPLAVIHAATDGQARVAADLIRNACGVSETCETKNPVIYEIITA